MSKISGYANSVSALGTDDLIDVSEKISSSPDVYESRKMTGATLATFISSYAANIISTDGLTMTANRTHDLGSYVLTFQNAGFAIEGAQTIKAASAVADMFNLYDSTGALLSRFNSTYISLWATSQIASEVFGVTGHTILKGVDTAGTSKALDIYDNDTVPTSLWSFRNNGDVYLGKSSDFNLSSNLLSFTTTGTSEYDAITTNTYNGSYVKYKNRGGVVIKSQSSNNAITVRNTGDTLDTFEVFSNGGGDWDCVNSDIRLGNFTNNDYVNIDNNGLFGIIGGVTHHEIGLLNTNAWTVFFKQGFTANSYFIIGGSAPVSYAKISLLDDTLMGNTGDKVGFMGTAPIVQVTTGVTAATFTANTSGIADDTATFDGYTIGQVVKALRNYGLLA